MVKIKLDELKEIGTKILIKHGMNSNETNIIVDTMIDDELRGRSSHGFAHLSRIVDVYKKSKKETITIIKENDCSALVDGGNSLGPIVANFSMKVAIDKVKSNGISIVGTINPDPFLTAGYYAKMATDENFIGIIAANSKARIMPWGGIDPIFGVNPIAIGIPTKERPIILDMALSRITISDIKAANREGKEIPSDLAVDANGKSTTNPNDALDGALFPIDTYKGYGLALAIELLAGPLVRGKAGKTIEGSRGYLFILVDPNIFTDVEDFKDSASRLIEEIKNSRKAEYVKDIFIPGEQSEKHRENALKRGFVEISDSVFNEIQKLI